MDLTTGLDVMADRDRKAIPICAKSVIRDAETRQIIIYNIAHSHLHTVLK
jgi:hypothetical protein